MAAAGYRVSDHETAQIAEGEEIQAFITQSPELLELYEDIEPQIYDIISEINAIKPEYVPAIGNFNYSDNIEEVQVLVKDFPELSEQFKSVSRVIPDLIGSNKSTRYLLLMQNEKELRSSGGLLTAFGKMEVKKGEIGDISAVDMWELNDDLVNWGIFPKIYSENGQLHLMITNNNRCGAAITRPQDSGHLS